MQFNNIYICYVCIFYKLGATEQLHRMRDERELIYIDGLGSDDDGLGSDDDGHGSDDDGPCSGHSDSHSDSQSSGQSSGSNKRKRR